ncbi:MAG: bifunctional ADP-heptose synthase [Bacteroidales bacterium]
MRTENIQQLFQGFTEKNVLIIGDVMIDSYMWGSVQRISPEAPIPIASIKERENRLGGASNVALNIKSLGATPIICSVTGDDANADEFLRLLENKDMDTAGIMKSEQRKTSVKTRIISGGQHLLRVDEENTDALNKEQVNDFSKHLKRILDSKKIDAIIFEDYDKGVLSPELIDFVVEMARKKNILVTADPKQRNFHAYKGVDLFKPNYQEMKTGLKTEFARDNLSAIQGLGTKLIKDMRLQYVLLTLAEAGSVIISRDNIHRVPAEIRDISDISGAGDTVIATATLCLTCGIGMKDIAYVSNLAGGLVCEYSGVVPVDKTELIKELKEKMPAYLSK